MDQIWNEAAQLLRSSQSALAATHFEQILRDSNPATTQPLLRQISNANFVTARNASAESREKININVPLIPEPSPSASQQVYFFTHEAILINAYNHALFSLKRLRPKSVEFITPIDLKLRDAITCVRPILEAFLYKVHVPIPSSSGDVCICICDMTQSLLTHQATFLSSIPHKHLRHYIFRWGRAAANALDLFSAIQMLMRISFKAINAASAASSLRSLCDILETSSSSNINPSQHSNGQNSGGIVNDKPNRTTSVHDDSCRTRTVYLKAVALACDENFESARSTLKQAADAHCVDDDSKRNLLSCQVMYMSALLPLLTNGRKDMQTSREVVKHAEWCVSTSYRIADALALAARAAPSIRRWQLATSALKFNDRSAALMLSSRCLGRVGMYDKQLELLELAENVLNHNLANAVKNNSFDIVGHIRLGETFNSGHSKDDAASHALTIPDIKGERVRVLYTLGRLDEAQQLIRELEADGLNQSHEWMLEEAACHAMNGIEVKLHSHSVSKIWTWWRRVAFGLACAESGLRRGAVNDAILGMNEAQKQCVTVVQSDLSLYEQMVRACVYYNHGVVMVCRGPGEVARADESFAAAQTAFDKCMTRSPKTRKMEDEPGDDVEMDDELSQLSLMATVGRCLALWGQGRKEDAAAHWVDKRGLRARTQTKPSKRMRSNGECSIDAGNESEKRCETLVCNLDEDVIQLLDDEFVAIAKL